MEMQSLARQLPARPWQQTHRTQQMSQSVRHPLLLADDDEAWLGNVTRQQHVEDAVNECW